MQRDSHQLNRIVRVTAGGRFDRLEERRGLGWTLMWLARRRSAP
jgi:hypothetical protein